MKIIVSSSKIRAHLEARVALARGLLDEHLHVAEVLEVLLHGQEPGVVRRLPGVLQGRRFV